MMKLIGILLASLVASPVLANDCSLPYLNACLQKYLPQCPQSRFPNPTTPGLTEDMLRPSDKQAIMCRLEVMSKCNILTLSEDNDSCLDGIDLKTVDPLASPEPSASPAMTPSHNKYPFRVFQNEPVAQAQQQMKCVCEDDDDDDSDYASFIK
jgi:hypothetical protein